jgi:hypothetical protein
MSRLARAMAMLAVGALFVLPAATAVAGASAPASKVPKVTLLAPGRTGGGAVPTFKWKKVRGAATYELAVVDKKGQPVWAWQGSATTVNLGGWPGKRPADAPGPVITKGCKWFVAALDDAGTPVAFSGLRPVSP